MAKMRNKGRFSILHRVATNLENMENLENSGNSSNFLNLRENSGKSFIFAENPEKLRECKICHIIVNENVFQGTFLSRVSQGKV